MGFEARGALKANDVYVSTTRVHELRRPNDINDISGIFRHFDTQKPASFGIILVAF